MPWVQSDRWWCTSISGKTANECMYSRLGGRRMQKKWLSMKKNPETYQEKQDGYDPRLLNNRK